MHHTTTIGFHVSYLDISLHLNFIFHSIYDNNTFEVTEVKICVTKPTLEAMCGIAKREADNLPGITFDTSLNWYVVLDEKPIPDIKIAKDIATLWMSNIIDQHHDETDIQIESDT